VHEDQQKDLAEAIGTVVAEMNRMYGIGKQVSKDEEAYAEFEQEKKDREFCKVAKDLVIDIVRERKMCELYEKWRMGTLSYAIHTVVDSDSLRSLITDRVCGDSSH